MKPMRFCMITTFYPPYSFGGDAVFVQSLARALARRGHEVDVIHCRDSYRALARGALPSGGTDEAGVTVHGLESGVGVLSPLATQQTGRPLFKTRQIHRILSAKRFDVIHFHNISLVGGPGILRYGDAIKLYTLHEHWLICPTHVLFKFQRAVCTEKECFRCQLSYHRPPQLWRYGGLMKKSLRHVDAFIAPTELIRQRHLAEYPDLHIVHLPLFLSSPTERAEAPALPTRPFFLFAGRLEKLKGLETIIPAIRKSCEFDLVIAGDGDYADELKRLAGDCERIHFLGRLTQAQLHTAYEHAIALLLPTVGIEVFPMVLLESFAARTPVIVRDLGPLPGIVAESGGGLVFRDDASLLAAMERLRNNSTLRDNLGVAGHKAWRTRWSEDAHLEHYFRLIGEIHARKQEPAAASAGSVVR